MFKHTKLQPGKWMTGVELGVIVIVMGLTFISVSVFADGNEQLGITLPEFKGKYEIGWVTLGAFGLRGEATALMKIPENAEIVAAYVYMSGYSNLTPSQLGDIMVTVSNGDTTITRAAKCIGYSQEGKNQCFTYRADATGVVSVGEKRYHVQSHTLPARPTSGAIYGGGLVAIYSLPNVPESKIMIADGLDYFDASQGFPATKTVVFPIEGNRFERAGSVKIFSGLDKTNAASAIWYQTGHGNPPSDNIIDAPGAVDYNNSSSSDPNVDTDPLAKTYGNRVKWAMVEFTLPVASEQDWVAFQLESQADKPNVSPYSGVWNMIAFKLPYEEVGAGSIGDRVFYDKNSNGLRDPMESGIPAVLVSLYQDNGDNVLDHQTDTFLDSVRTNRLGFYQFQYLKVGSFFVQIDHPYLSDTSVVLTTGKNPAGPINVVDGTPILDVDFGFNYKGQRQRNPVQLGSFSSMTDSSGIWINWTTMPGTGNMGFDIFKSISQWGDFSLLNQNVIPVANGTGGFNHYSFFDSDVEPGQTYYYKLGDVDLSGEVTLFGPISATAYSTRIFNFEVNHAAPDNYKLGEAYPNPFNSKTIIQFSLPEAGLVEINIYNLTGQKIRTLVAEIRGAGNHSVSWDGKDELGQQVGSGIYWYQMAVANYQASKKILYLK